MKVNIVVLSIALSASIASLQAQTSVEKYGVPYRTLGGRDLKMDIQKLCWQDGLSESE